MENQVSQKQKAITLEDVWRTINATSEQMKETDRLCGNCRIALRQWFRHLRAPQGALCAHRHRRRHVYHGETWGKKRILKS